MTVFKHNRPEKTNPNLIMSALTCPTCTWKDPNNPVKANATTIYHGNLGADLTWTCTNCGQPQRVPVNPERYRQLSDAWLKISIIDDEMEDPTRTGATTIDLKTNTALSLTAAERAWEDFIGQYKSEHPDM